MHGLCHRISAPRKTASLLKILDVLRIVGMGFSSNLDMPLNDRPRYRIGTEHAPFALAVAPPNRETPFLVGGVIAAFDPAARFVGMVPARPAPKHLPHAVAHPIKGALGGHMAMVVGPAPQQRTERADQDCRADTTTAPGQCARLLQP